MSEDRIDSIINVPKIEQELKDATSGIKDLVALIKSVKDKSVQVSAAASIAEYRKLRTELDFLTKQTELATKAAINEAKVREANAKATVAETKATEAATKAKEKETAATNKQAEAAAKATAKKTEEARPYKQLALAFALAAKHAQDLAVKYGTMDKRSQAAAKRANELNNELKKIDASIGNHQRNVGNYSSAFDKAGQSLRGFTTSFLSLIGIASVGSLFKSSIDEFLEMDKNVRQLQNTLKNLGVPEAFDRMSASANRLQKEFGYIDNDDIIKSFQQIAVYGKLTEKQINDLLPVIINYAADSGKSINEATEDIIKALDGQGRAFKLYDLEVKATNTTTENLSKIMGDLAPKVEGAGKAFADSAAGGLAQANQEFKDMKEEIGQGLLPVLNELLGFLLKVGKGAKILYNDIKDLFRLKPGETREFNNLLVSAADNTQKFLDTIKDKKPEEQLQAVGDELYYINEQLKYAQNAQRITGKDASGTILTEKLSEKEQKSDLTYLNERKRILEETKKVLSTPANVIIGGGDPNALSEEERKRLAEKNRALKEKAAKDAADLSERIRKAEFETTKALQEERIKIQEEIFKDESKSFDVRVAALREFVQEKARLIELERQFEKGAKGLTKEEIAKIEADKQTDVNQLLRDGHAEYNKILEGQQKEEQRLTKENADRITAIHDKLRTDIEKGLKDANDKLLQDIKDRADAQKAVGELEKELAQEVQTFIFGLFDARFTREKNEIQDQIDLLEKKKQKDIEVANATITNAQDRAAAITVIEARAAAQEEQLEQKKRQIDIKRAKFEKASAIVSTISQTAQNHVEALSYLSNPITAPLYPLISGLITAIGAFQLGTIIAQPIPKFKHGGTHKGGLMIVGDGGKSEGIELPDGTIMKTPSVPTLMDAPKDTKIHPDFSKMMLKATVTNVPVFKETTRSDRTEVAVLKMEKSVVTAIKKIPQQRVTVQNIISQRIRSGNSNTTIANAS